MRQSSRADAIVREMSDLGARFAIDDDENWTWQPDPEIMRGAIRRYWTSIVDRPCNADIVAAIRLLQQGGVS